MGACIRRSETQRALFLVYRHANPFLSLSLLRHTYVCLDVHHAKLAGALNNSSVWNLVGSPLLITRTGEPVTLLITFQRIRLRGWVHIWICWVYGANLGCGSVRIYAWKTKRRNTRASIFKIAHPRSVDGYHRLRTTSRLFYRPASDKVLFLKESCKGRWESRARTMGEDMIPHGCLRTEAVCRALHAILPSQRLYHVIITHCRWKAAVGHKRKPTRLCVCVCVCVFVRERVSTRTRKNDCQWRRCRWFGRCGWLHCNQEPQALRLRQVSRSRTPYSGLNVCEMLGEMRQDGPQVEWCCMCVCMHAHNIYTQNVFVLGTHYTVSHLHSDGWDALSRLWFETPGTLLDEKCHGHTCLCDMVKGTLHLNRIQERGKWSETSCCW